MTIPLKNTTVKLSACIALAISLNACSTVYKEEPPSPMPTGTPEIVLDSPQQGAIYQASTNRFFFEDIRARRVGDLINVILDERTDATKSATTNANKGTTIALPSPTLFGGKVTGKGRDLLANDISGNSTFAGTADSSQSNRLNGSVAVVIRQVLPNGNLIIEGEKRLTLNQGSEIVKVSGLIRQEDITPQNTVISNQIANANITYGGSGLLADSNRAGWMTRIFTSPLWPF